MFLGWFFPSPLKTIFINHRMLYLPRSVSLPLPFCSLSKALLCRLFVSFSVEAESLGKVKRILFQCFLVNFTMDVFMCVWRALQIIFCTKNLLQFSVMRVSSAAREEQRVKQEEVYLVLQYLKL